jgi:UDP-glucose 4-epimerase
MHDIDAVVHLACTTSPARSMEMMAWDAETNITPSLYLFEAAVRAGVERVVFSSSGGTVYGAPEALPVQESAPTRPRSAYGVSKLAIENYLGLHSQLRGISLRVANPYGAFQLRGASVGLLAKAVAAVKAGEAIEIWGDGSVVRDYIAINDVISAFHAAITAAALPAGAYNIGSGVGYSVNEILAAVFEVIGRDVPVRYLVGRPYDVSAIYLDCSRFTLATSWRPRKALQDGIVDMWCAAGGEIPDRSEPCN